jgi:hypothetical protein
VNAPRPGFGPSIETHLAAPVPPHSQALEIGQGGETIALKYSYYSFSFRLHSSPHPPPTSAAEGDRQWPWRDTSFGLTRAR